MVTALDLELERIAAGQHSLLTRRQAANVGASKAAIRHRLSTGRLLVHRPGVYRLVGGPLNPLVDLMAAVLAVPGSVASIHAAAGLVGIPGFAVSKMITVVGTARPRTPDVRVHRTLFLPRHHRVIRDQIPCTSVARTIFDLCGAVHPRRAERAMDNALARRMVTLPALGRILDELAEHGRGGTVLMRELLAARPVGYVAPESELEARFVALLDEHGLPQPTRQLDLGDADAWIGRVDFVFREQRIVVEVDGREGHSSLLDQLADTHRDRRLVTSGRVVLRFGWDDVCFRGALVAELVRTTLHARAPVQAVA